MPVTKNDIINKFNTLFRAALAQPAGSATNYAGHVTGSPAPNITNHPDLGSPSEPLKYYSDIPPQAGTGIELSTSIFNILHNFAMEFTRVRQARWIYITGPSTHSEDTTYRLTALKPQFALYFPIPEYPLPGEIVEALDVDDFLRDLRSEVDSRRSSSTFGHIFAVCYAAAPPPCHGSRGRR